MVASTLSIISNAVIRDNIVLTNAHQNDKIYCDKNQCLTLLGT